MATTLTKQTLVDSNRHAVIKIVGVGGGDANASLVVAANLAYAINATGVVSQTNPKRLNRVAIKRIWGNGQLSNGSITLKWGGNANSSIVTFGNGPFDYNFDSGSTPGTIEIPDSANCTGDIVFSSTAGGGSDTWTLFIDLKKDGRDYDQGQTRDPAAFNAGPYSR